MGICTHLRNSIRYVYVVLLNASPSSTPVVSPLFNSHILLSLVLGNPVLDYQPWFLSWPIFGTTTSIGLALSAAISGKRFLVATFYSLPSSHCFSSSSVMLHDRSYRFPLRRDWNSVEWLREVPHVKKMERVVTQSSGSQTWVCIRNPWRPCFKQRSIPCLSLLSFWFGKGKGQDLHL